MTKKLLLTIATAAFLFSGVSAIQPTPAAATGANKAQADKRAAWVAGWNDYWAKQRAGWRDAWLSWDGQKKK